MKEMEREGGALDYLVYGSPSLSTHMNTYEWFLFDAKATAFAMTPSDARKDCDRNDSADDEDHMAEFGCVFGCAIHSATLEAGHNELLIRFSFLRALVEIHFGRRLRSMRS